MIVVVRRERFASRASKFAKEAKQLLVWRDVPDGTHSRQTVRFKVLKKGNQSDMCFK